MLEQWLARIPHDPQFRALRQHWAADPGRSFARLPETQGFEAWFVRWPPGSLAPLHDHGSASGAVAVISGRLFESFRTSSSSSWQQRCWAPTARIGLASGLCHEVRNLDARPAYSVHVYEPRLERMTFYDRTPAGGVQPIRVELAAQW